jgi:16S rRNA (cytosine967-C5)-methyltransferase
MPISPARRAAFEILRRVSVEDAYASSLLATLDERLAGDDRGLCHELVLGVLRRQLWLDRVIEHFGNRRLDKIDLPVKLALRLGLYQLRFLSRIPPSAAVNESVNLVRAAGLRSAAGFANAVLRGATRAPDYDPSIGVSDPIQRFAIETSHPPWLIERWSAVLGVEEAAALARANNQPAPLAFRLTSKTIGDENEAKQVIDQLTAAGFEVQPSKIAPNAWRVSGQRPALLRKFIDAGLIYLQDEASQLVAHFLEAQTADRVLDVCAAPGSKTTLIAALAPQATIVGVDLYEHRLRTLRELAAVQGNDSIQAAVADATGVLPFAKALFDRVLVDAPCSGTGTLRRNPEIRWRLNSSDISELAIKQNQILKQAAEMVRPGGRLVYSTCSLENEENEAVVQAFLKEHPTFEPFTLPKLNIANAPVDLLSATGAIRTWPNRHDVDGFFVIAFQLYA